MSEHSGWVFLWNAWEISLRFHKYGFVLLNRLRIVANTIFSNPKTGNYWKNRQKWVSFEKPLQYIVTYLDSTDFTKYIIPKSSPAHRKKNLNFFCICSEVTAQTRLRMPIKLWPMTSRHLTRHNICDDFWLPSSESFPTIYNMNDFAAIIFSRYYTLITVR